MSYKQLGRVLLGANSLKSVLPEYVVVLGQSTTRDYSKALEKTQMQEVQHPQDVPPFVKQGPIGTLIPTASGLTPTQHALTYPNPQISYDDTNHQRYHPGDPQKRAFTYFVMLTNRALWMTVLRLHIITYLYGYLPGTDKIAGKNMELNVSEIEPGTHLTIKFQGKPVFIWFRNQEQIDAARAVPMEELRDPEEDQDRALKNSWILSYGICTHLGCVPIYGAGSYGGYFCPCHGSHYDQSARVRKGPAPKNLPLVEAEFMPDGKTLLLGGD